MEKHEVTPITKRVGWFDKVYREIYESKFSDTYVNIIYDAFCVRIDNSWVEKNLYKMNL